MAAYSPLHEQVTLTAEHTLGEYGLRLRSTIGVGAYGVVCRAQRMFMPVTADRSNPPPIEYAVKVLVMAEHHTAAYKQQLRELSLHDFACRHPNIVTIHKTIQRGDLILIIMDLCLGGDLFTMITERQRYIGDDHLIKRVFSQIVRAVQHCHDMGIFHRDLKPENILCSRSGEDVYLADFGLATTEKHSRDFGCGSTFYMSPECQGGLADPRQFGYSTKANDIWSLGVILVNLTCGRNPWRQATLKDETFRAFVQNPDFLRTILPISVELNDLLKRIFKLNPEERISLTQLLSAIAEIETFTMSENELRLAHAAAQSPANPTSHRSDSARYRSCIPDGPSFNSDSPILGTALSNRIPEGSVQHTPQLEHNRTLSSSEDDARLPQTPPYVVGRMPGKDVKVDFTAPNPCRSPSPLDME